MFEISHNEYNTIVNRYQYSYIKIFIHHGVYVRIDYRAIGARIKQKRVEKGMAQKELAHISSYTIQYIRNIELAHARPGLQTIIRIADALDCSVDSLLCDSIIHSTSYIKQEINELFKTISAKQMREISGIIESLSSDMDF